MPLHRLIFLGFRQETGLRHYVAIARVRTANDKWRLCFRFVEGDAYDVEIVDYHN